jgi:hypothetical protein
MKWNNNWEHDDVMYKREGDNAYNKSGEFESIFDENDTQKGCEKEYGRIVLDKLEKKLIIGTNRIASLIGKIRLLD